MAKVGRLNVKAPSGTSVWVDGVAAQWVEGEPIDVSPGAHDVQLKNAIGAKTRKVDAPAGQVTFVEWEDPTGVVPVTNNPTNPNPTPTTTNPTTASGEPVEEFALMLAEGGGKPFERREAGAHCHRRPAVEELPTPDARVVGPEVLELFLPQVPPNRAQVDSDQVAESSPLEKGEVLGILGPQPASLGEYDLASGRSRGPHLVSAHRVDGFAEHLRDVEPVEDVDSRSPSAYDVEEGPPHVARDEDDRQGARLAQHLEEAIEAGCRALLGDVEQATLTVVELVCG